MQMVKPLIWAFSSPTMKQNILDSFDSFIILMRRRDRFNGLWIIEL